MALACSLARTARHRMALARLLAHTARYGLALALTVWLALPAAHCGHRGGGWLLAARLLRTLYCTLLHCALSLTTKAYGCTFKYIIECKRQRGHPHPSVA